MSQFSRHLKKGRFEDKLILVIKIEAGMTYIRNPVITKVFREAGYMEKLGFGFITVFRSYEEMGLAPLQVIEGENYIKCILPWGTAAAL